MKVSVGSFFQGVCDSATAEASAEKYPDTKIIATCTVCGHSQRIKKMADQCHNCKSQTWK